MEIVDSFTEEHKPTQSNNARLYYLFENDWYYQI